jgi:tetratricopeptide (TPR) repeat protein
MVPVPDKIAGKLDQALAALQLGEQGRAERLLLNVLRSSPRRLEALVLLSRIRARQGRLDDAAALLQRAGQNRPDDADAQYNLGVAWGELDSHDHAIVCYRNALRADPHHLDASNNLAATLIAVSRWSEALPVLQDGLKHHPNDAALLGKIGVALKETGRVDEAIRIYHRAISIKPREASIHANLGLALQELGRLDEAIASFRRALSLGPETHTRSLLALALYENGQVDAAIETMRQATALCPQDPELHANLGMMLLAKGQFGEGWAEREYRAARQRPHTDRPWVEAPFWKGEALAGRSILVHAEQGLGDTLQFARYLPLLAARKAAVTFACQAALIPILRSLAGNIRIVARPHADERFDFQAALLSLPGRFGTGQSNVPNKVPYLAIEDAAVACWRERIKGRGLAVGISWQGNPEFVGDRERSIPLQEFAPLADISALRLISLQKGAGADQITKVPFASRIAAPLDPQDVGPEAIIDTAAVMMSCDLIVTSCTMTAHLAGALARPVLVALRHIPDWRWLLAGDESAWYPTARLFRQPRPRDWQDVFARIAAEVRARVA